jgi:hypothetical protein
MKIIQRQIDEEKLNALKKQFYLEKIKSRDVDSDAVAYITERRKENRQVENEQEEEEKEKCDDIEPQEEEEEEDYLSTCEDIPENEVLPVSYANNTHTRICSLVPFTGQIKIVTIV